MATNTSELDILIKAQDQASGVFKQTESSIIRLVGAVSSLVSVLAAALFPIKSASDFQAELINVAKTTNFTNDQIGALSDGLKELSSQVDVTAVDLAKIAAIAGQLGLGGSGSQGILQFTATASRMASVLGITAEEAAQGAARLLNIFKINVTEVERIGSLLNEVSNNSTASGKELIDMVQRIGTAGTVLNATQATALAATGRDLGLTVETVGTSFQKVFLHLQTDADKIAPAIGKPVHEFISILKNDGIAGLKLYLDALAKMDAQTRASFIQQSSGGGRIFGLVTALADDASKGYDILDRNVRNATVGFEGGTSAIREQERVIQGLGKQFQLFKNNLLALVIDVGTKAIPFLTELIKSTQEFLKDPKTIDNVIEFGKSIGAWVTSMVDAIKWIADLSTHMGFLFRIIEGIILFKLAGLFAGMVLGLISSANNARLAAAEFYNLASGRTAVAVAAAEAAAIEKAAGASTIATNEAVAASRAKAFAAATGHLGPIGMQAGAALGNLPGGQAINQEAANKAAKAAADEAAAASARAMKAEQELIALRQMGAGAYAASRSAGAAFDLEQRTILANIAHLEEGIALARANGTKAAAEILPVLRGQLEEERLLYIRLGTNIGARREELALQAESLRLAIAAKEVEISKAGATAATAATVAATEAAKAAEIAAAGVSGAAVVGLRGTLGKLWTTIVAWVGRAVLFLTNPYVLIGVLIATVVGSIYWDQISSFFVKLLGISNTTTQQMEQDARIRAAAVEKEAQNVRNLADEYDKLSAKKDFKKNQAKDLADPAQSSTFAASLSESLKIVGLIEAKMKAVHEEIANSATTYTAIGQSIATATSEYHKQEIIIADIQMRANNVASAMSLYGKGSAARTGQENILAGLDASLVAAREKAAGLKKDLSDLAQARAGAEQAGLDSAKQIPDLQDQLSARYKGMAPVFDADSVSLLRQAAAIARLRDTMESLHKASASVIDTATHSDATQEQKTEAANAQARMKAYVSELNDRQKVYEAAQAKLSLLATTRTIPALVADPMKGNAAQLLDVANKADAIVNHNITKFSEQVNSAQDEIDKLRMKLANLAGERGAASFAGNLNDVARIDLEINATTRQLELEKQKRETATANISLVEGSQVSEERKTAAVKEGTIALIADISGLAQRYRQLIAQSAAQQVFVTAAQRSAAVYMAIWEKAKTDAQNVISSGLKEIATLIERAKQRRQVVELVAFDINTTRVKSSLDRALDLYSQYRRRQFDLEGLTPEERDRKEWFLNQQIAYAKEVQDKAGEAERVAFAYNQAQMAGAEAAGRVKAIQDQIEGKQALQKVAVESGNTQRVRELQEEIKALEIKGEMAVEVIKKTRAKMAEESDKIIAGEHTGIAPPVVDPAKVQADAEASIKAEASIAVRRAAIAEKTATAQQQASLDQTAIMNRMNIELDEIAAKAGPIAAMLGLTVGQYLDKVGKALKGTNEDLDTFIARVGEIARSNIADPFKIPELSAQMDVEGVKIRDSIRQTAMDSAAIWQAAGFGANKEVLAGKARLEWNLDQSVKEREAFVDELNKKEQARQLLIKNLGFDGTQVHTALQTAADQGESITAKVKFNSTEGGAATGILKQAGGGFIRGPGTSTSDSILSWLSAGEYVNDAKTVSAFGPGFFAMLKSISRSGSGVITDFLQGFGGLTIPRFATGGPVDFGQLAGAGSMVANGAVDTVRVELAVGGQQVTLYTERDQARALTKMLKNISRSI